MYRSILVITALVLLAALVLWYRSAPARSAGAAAVPAGFEREDLPSALAVPPAGSREALPPPRADPAVEPDPASRSARRARTGSIRARVRTADGDAVPDCEIELLGSAGGERVRRAVRTSDARGLVLFETLRPALYHLRVAQESLPAGLLAPEHQDHAPAVASPGFHLAPAQVEAGEVAEVELLVHRAAGLQGYVRALDGTPWVGGSVRIGLRALSHVFRETTPDGGGFYDFGPLVPGVYSFTLHPAIGSVDSSPFLHEFPQVPDPVLTPGVVQRLDVELGPGPWTVVGRVVDEDGNGLADLSVLCAYGAAPTIELPFDSALRAAVSFGRVRTDARGHFEVPGVYRAGLWLTPGDLECAMGAPYGQNRLARFSTPRHYDLTTGAGRFDTGTHVLPRSRPFRVRGKVELDPAWPEGRRVGMDGLQLSVSFDTPRNAEFGYFPGVRVDFDPETGAFDWWCESFHAQVVFVIRSRAGEPRIELPFQPIEGGDLEGLRVRFPG